MNSFDLLLALKAKGYIKTKRDVLWWPRSKTFWVIVGAVLTQQSKWEKVEQSIHNLEVAGIKTLEGIAKCSLDRLVEFIKPSGFYNTKANNLKKLCLAILEDFKSFELFCEEVTRDWLLEQKGIGPESADSILCYACGKEAMVVDAYTARLLESFGYQFESYDALQEWMVEGIVANQHRLVSVYGHEKEFNEVYARFHGKIVEFCKENSRGKKVESESLGL
ncbi:MAG: 3-methyladenine DNA glycosylase [Sulfurospirillaceae bacterium]|nr:3-methyladenine DNA glycosylase [Sulfurospirillaceae bacterium]MDD2827609.1 3-methyladenine DNA glycosylase [Sulfurospirillaceae bacterium]